MSGTETIEQKTARLMLYVLKHDTSKENIETVLDEFGEDEDFRCDCSIVELAIAEEREACVACAEEFWEDPSSLGPGAYILARRSNP